MASPTRATDSVAADRDESRTDPSRMHRRPQLSDEVASHLRSAIMSGSFRSGEFIRLDETAAELGVSVTPVREALLTLRGEGMVESAPNRGYRVSSMSGSDIDDIFWLQGQLAVEIALRAVDRAHAGDLERLTELNERLRACVAASKGSTGSDGVPDIERIADAEWCFHREVNRIASSPKLAWFLDAAARTLPYRLFARDRQWGVVAVRSHEQLIAAMRVGDHNEVITQTLLQFEDAAARLLAHRKRFADADGGT